jgi:hypothetical protein
MKIPAPIPEKISINLLYEYLGLSAMSQDAKLEALKSHSKDSGLLFTFDEALRGIPVDIPLSEIYDETDEFKPAKREYIQCIFKPKSFTLNDYSIDKGKAFTCIRRFEVSEVGFNITNKDKSNFGSYDVDLAKAYVKKLDFINFMDESGDNVLLDLPVNLQLARTNKACVSAPRQEASEYPVLEQRYNFLYDWTKKALQGVPFDEFIAKYDEELTKETFYELLSNEYKKNHPNDSNIFVSGADEFYKDKRITLKFKGGRRKNS